MKITITNCWSYYNKGDAAIAVATIKLIRETIPNADITLLAFNDQSFAKHKKDLDGPVKILPMPTIIDSFRPIRILFNLASCVGLPGLFGSLFLMLSLASTYLLRHIDRTLDRTLRSIDDSDMVIVVGGNYIYSHFGFYIHAIPIAYAKFVRKKKTIMLGHSIGPFEDTMSRIISRIILSHIDLIVFREELSHSYVKENLRINLPNTLISGDMTFFLQAPEVTCERLESQPRVGITARKWLFNRPDLYERYLDSIIQTAFNLIRDGFEIYVIPFSYVKGGENDLDPCRAIYNKISDKYPKEVHLIDVKEESPTSLVKIMRNLGLRVFIGTRMHSVILASLAGVPSVIISYQHFKAHGISKQLGLHYYVIDIENIKPDRLMRYVNKLIKNREKERKNLTMAVQRFKKIDEPRINSILLSLMSAD